MIADATGSQQKTIRAFLRDGVRSALDVGCGTGEKTARIAQQTDETVGIDPDTGHVRKAQARHGRRYLCFLTARAEALCFTAASFDAVFFNQSLHHVPAAHQHAALRESHRVLKPRGRMLVIEPIHGSGALGRTLRLYLEEKEQEASAAAAIEAVLNAEFELQTRSEIIVEDGFAAFEDFFECFQTSRPEAGSDRGLKQDLKRRFQRCHRNPRGITIIDYAACVWHLVRA